MKTSEEPICIITGDFDDNGVVDLATANFQFGDVSVLLGNGDGTFGKPSNHKTAGQSGDIVTGDFNLDGIADLAVANRKASSEDLSILLGTGGGNFGSQMTISLNSVSVIGSPRGLTTGDYDGDGSLDLATTFGSLGSAARGTIAVLLGNGDGTFETPDEYPSDGVPYSIISADFDGDGELDLATANRHAENVSVLMGQGDGTFGAQTAFYSGELPIELTAADLNDDNRLDIIAINNLDDDITILYNQGGDQLLIGDVNQDGVVDLLDVFPFVTLLSTGGFQEEADANQDGVVDLLDVEAFVELLTGN